MKLKSALFFSLILLVMCAGLTSCSKPKPVELLLNGEFDDEQALGPKGSPNAYDHWIDWHTDFVNNSVGFASVFVNNDPGYGEGDFKRAISWANGNYSLTLTQQLSAPKGQFEGSVALLLGSGNYTRVSLSILAADGKTVLATIDNPQDRTGVTEEASNATSDKDWQVLTIPVTFTQAQEISFVIQVALGEGGKNPFIRVDNASLKGFPEK